MEQEREDLRLYTCEKCGDIQNGDNDTCENCKILEEIKETEERIKSRYRRTKEIMSEPWKGGEL